jgi:hypothetical protein
VVAAAAALSFLPAASAAPATPKTDAELARSASRIEAHVRFLADDLLEGREAGTRGHDLAALYVATQFRLMGLEPAGENGSFFQTVPMRSGTLLRDGARLAVARDGRITELVFEEDFLPSVNFDTGECALEAPMVFVGQGVYAPELDHDDFAGVDLRGKVAVLLANAPARFPNDQRAFHASDSRSCASSSAAVRSVRSSSATRRTRRGAPGGSMPPTGRGRACGCSIATAAHAIPFRGWAAGRACACSAPR